MPYTPRVYPQNSAKNVHRLKSMVLRSVLYITYSHYLRFVYANMCTSAVFSAIINCTRHWMRIIYTRSYTQNMRRHTHSTMYMLLLLISIHMKADNLQVDFIYNCVYMNISRRRMAMIIIHPLGRLMLRRV